MDPRQRRGAPVERYPGYIHRPAMIGGAAGGAGGPQRPRSAGAGKPQRTREIDTHEILKAMAYGGDDPKCGAHFDKSRPCPAEIYGIADTYVELDSWAKNEAASDFAKGKITFNFAVADGSRDDAVGVRTEVPTVIESIVEPFTIPLPDDLYDEAATDAATAIAALSGASVAGSDPTYPEGTSAALTATTGALTATYGNGTDGVGATLTSTATTTSAAVVAATTTVLPLVDYVNGTDGVGATLTERSQTTVTKATTAALPAATYNGAVSPATLTADANGIIPDVDGSTVLVTDTILVKDQANAIHNGTYAVTSVGSASTPWVLRRHVSYDTGDSFDTVLWRTNGDGATLDGRNFYTTGATAVIGTDQLDFASYPVGAFAVDGVTLGSSDRFLVKDQLNAAHNGVYTVTNVGGFSNAYEFTRATDADTSAEIQAGYFVPSGGTVNSDTTYILPAATYTFGTTDIVWGTSTGDDLNTLLDMDPDAAVGDLILVKDQADATENGVYEVTTVPAVGVQSVLTRSALADTSAELLGRGWHISSGSLAGKFYRLTGVSSVTIGTTAINWSLATDTKSLDELTHGFSQMPFGRRVTLQFEEFGRQARLGRDPHAKTQRAHHVELVASTPTMTDRLTLTPLSSERGYFVFVDPIKDVHDLTVVLRGVDRPLVLPVDSYAATPSVSSGNLLFTGADQPPLSVGDRIYLRGFASDAAGNFDSYVNRPDGHLVGSVPSSTTMTLNPAFSGLTITPSGTTTVSVAKNRIRISLRMRSVVDRLTNYISP